MLKVGCQDVLGLAMYKSFQIVENGLVSLVQHLLWVFLNLILLNNKFQILTSQKHSKKKNFHLIFYAISSPQSSRAIILLVDICQQYQQIKNMQNQKQQISQEVILQQELPRSASITPVVHHNSQYKCRICSESNQSKIALNSYCSCSIDKGGMHQNCLKQFLQRKINKKVEKQLDYTNELQCQLCNQSFCVNIQTNYKCRDSENLKQYIKRNTFLIGILFIGFFLSLIALISCSYQLDQKLKIQSGKRDMQINQTLTAFIVLSATVLILFSWKIIFNILFVAKITINF